MILAAFLALQPLPTQIPNPGFEQELTDWRSDGHRGFRAGTNEGPGGRWLTAGWAARNAAPPGARYSITTRVGAAPYRGRRIRISTATRLPDFAQGAVTLFATAGISENSVQPRASTAWRRHGFVLSVSSRADDMELGFILEGTRGQLDADDIRIEVVR